ncbi:MAG: dihydrodipicolinate synthase family protein [Planctomycetaceae bacterium]|nr:dihydrodipicolinate synthase family protein [Planctomycetaceae bacterium]
MSEEVLDHAVRTVLNRGTVIPAHPMALDANRKLDEIRQRALSRYYIAAGAGGLAVGVHTTQFSIRDPKIGLFEPVLRIAMEEMDRADLSRTEPLVRVGGIRGDQNQAVAEAKILKRLGYHAGLLSLPASKSLDEDALITHCKAVAEIIPMIGFYLHAPAGGRELPYSFWKRFVEIPEVVAIKIAAFNRYQTIDVIRALAESGRDDIALYTGNDDNIVMDLLTPFRFVHQGKTIERRFVGGLLGHWAVWTKQAVELHKQCQQAVKNPNGLDWELVRRNVEVTDCNAVLFDAANHFQGVIPGVHEVLRRQGLLEGTWCLDPNETLSPGQKEEIDRIYASYPHLTDDEFIAEHRDEWLGS